MRLALAVLMMALSAPPASAQERGAPAPTPPPALDGRGTGLRSYLYLKPETEAAAAKAEARMHALERRSAKRVRHVTGSICHGCSGGREAVRSRSANAQAPGSDQRGDGIVIRDPAQARLD